MTTSYRNAPEPKIVIVDFASGVNRDELWPTANALTKQANLHFALPPPFGYGVGATVRVATPKTPPKPDEWVLGLFSEPDQPDALGYHDQSEHGLPMLKVFPMLDTQDGTSWSVTASHEVLETLADPNLARCAQAPDGKFWAYEVCDAVETDTYEIDGVTLSNFVLPPYFEPPAKLDGVKFDHMGLIKKPYEIRPGGYGQYWSTNGWKQVLAHKGPRAARLKIGEMRIGRGAHRAGRILTE